MPRCGQTPLFPRPGKSSGKFVCASRKRTRGDFRRSISREFHQRFSRELEVTPVVFSIEGTLKSSARSNDFRIHGTVDCIPRFRSRDQTRDSVLSSMIERTPFEEEKLLKREIIIGKLLETVCSRWCKFGGVSIDVVTLVGTYANKFHRLTRNTYRRRL